MTQQHDTRPPAVNQFGTPVNQLGTPLHTAPTFLPAAVPEQGTDGVSVAGLVLAILFWPVGLVLSIVGMSRTKGGRRGRGLAVAGLVVSLVQIALLPLLAAVAIPVYLNQRDKAADQQLRMDLVAAAKEMEIAAVDSLEGYPATLPTEYLETSPGVTVTLVGSTADSYCLRATDGDRVLYMDESTVASPTPCG